MTPDVRQHAVPVAFDLVDWFVTLRDPTGPVVGAIDNPTFRVVEAIRGGLAVPLAEPVDLLVERTPSNIFRWTGRTRDARGEVRAGMLVPGTRHVVLLLSAAYGLVEFQTDLLPTTDFARMRILLPPGPSYRFEALDPARPGPDESRVGGGPTLLRASILGVDGRPEARARVSALVRDSSGDLVRLTDQQATRASTDANGQCVLAFGSAAFTGSSGGPPVPSILVTLRVDFRDGSTINVSRVTIVRGRESRLVQAALVGTVVDGEGRPADGAEVRVDTDPDLESVSRRAGRWLLAFPLDRHMGQGAPADAEVTVRRAGLEARRRVQIESRRSITIQEPFRLG